MPSPATSVKAHDVTTKMAENGDVILRNNHMTLGASLNGAVGTHDVGLTLSDDSDEESTCTSELSNASTTQSSQNGGSVNGHGSNKSGKKVKRRRRKKRKVKPSNLPSLRSKKSESPVNKADLSSKSDSAINVPGRPTVISKVNKVTLTTSKPLSEPKLNGAFPVTKRIHSAPTVISKRIERQEYQATTSMRTLNGDLKSNSTVLQTQTRKLAFVEKDTNSTHLDHRENAQTISSSGSPLDRQKSVLSNLKTTLQRSLPPVTLNTQTLSLNHNIQPPPHTTQPHHVVPNSSSSHQQPTSASRISLRFNQNVKAMAASTSTKTRGSSCINSMRSTAQPLSTHQSSALSRDATHFLRPNGSIVTSNKPEVHLGSNCNLDKSECQAVSQVSNHSSYRHMDNSKVNQNKAKDEQSVKSILRKESVESSEVVNNNSQRKSVRFNENDQIMYM